MRVLAVLTAIVFVHSATAAIVVQSVNISGTASESRSYVLNDNTLGSSSDHKSFTLNAAGDKYTLLNSQPPSYIANRIVFYTYWSRSYASGQLNLSNGILAKLYASQSNYVNSSGGFPGFVDSQGQMDISFDVTNTPASLSFDNYFISRDNTGYNSTPSYELVDLSTGSLVIHGNDLGSITNFTVDPGNYRFSFAITTELYESANQVGSAEGYCTLKVVPEASSLILTVFPIFGLLLWKRRILN